MTDQRPREVDFPKPFSNRPSLPPPPPSLSPVSGSRPKSDVARLFEEWPQIGLLVERVTDTRTRTHHHGTSPADYRLVSERVRVSVCQSVCVCVFVRECVRERERERVGRDNINTSDLSDTSRSLAGSLVLSAAHHTTDGCPSRSV